MRKIILLLTLALAPASVLLAANESYIQTLTGKLKQGDSCVVVDDKFLNLPLSDWNQVRNLSVDNIITFELRNDTSIYYYNKPFTCTLNISVKYFTSRDQDQPDEINNVELVVKFDTVTGKYYPVTAQYKFRNAFKVVVTINSITSAEWGSSLPAIFRLKNQILVERKYPFNTQVVAPILISTSSNTSNSSSGNMMTALSVNTVVSPQNNQVNISWNPADFIQSGANSEEYDVEWTYIDALGDHGSDIVNTYTTNGSIDIPDNIAESWMRNDNSRVTVNGTSYTINLPYADGYILVRIRGASYDVTTNVRLMTNWQYRDASNKTAIVIINAHESDLNWEYSASFAEEGKLKEVISYFDGTLRNRQSVTINNSDNVAVVQETIYDNMGRPAVNILPAPTDNSSINYYAGFNLNSGGLPYSGQDIYAGVTGNDHSCKIGADEMNTSSGASRYYSPNNPFLNNSAYSNYYFTRYVPDAEKFPYSLTEYMADNTFRVRRQGGMGRTFQIGAGRESQYFYGKPAQKELDRLFGMEVGNSSHYLKNMVVDPNGRITVSYIDAGGRTIATALAGGAPSTMDAVPSAQSSEAHAQLDETLIQSPDFRRDAGAMMMQASATFLAEVNGTFQLHYSINPAAVVTKYGPNHSLQLCSNCYYDVLIEVKNDCGELINSATTTPFTGNDVTCYANPLVITQELDVQIARIGEYTVTYTLKLSDDVIKYQTDYFINNNTDLRTLEQFFGDQLQQLDLSGCYSTCEACKSLGTDVSDPSNPFRQKVMQLLDDPEFQGVDKNAAVVQSWISSTWTVLKNRCTTLSCVTSPCEDYLAVMKNDVMPGGQYAIYDPTTYLVPNGERGVSVLLNYKSDAQITNFQFTDDNGVTHHIKDADVTEDMFIKAYIQHPEWADDFVKRHIEYCSYLWCKDQGNPQPAVNNEVSYAFDKTLRQEVTSGSDAQARGYYDRNNISALLNVDPFFNNGGRGTGAYNGTTYRNAMLQDLQNLSTVLQMTLKDASNNYLPVKNILQLVDWLLYCKPTNANAGANDFINSWQNCTPGADCRSVTREWELYRNYYLQLKSKYVRLAKLAYDPSCTDCFIGKDGLNTMPSPTCVSMKGSNSNPAFSSSVMVSFAPSNGNPTASDLMAAAWTCNALGIPECDFRSLFKWDLSSIPANVTITSATLYLYANTSSSNGNPGNPDFGTANAAYLRRVTSPWAAATTGWNNQPSLSTSDQKTLPQSTSTTQNYTVDVTSFVAQWVSNPSTNYGMILQLQNETHYNSLIFGGPGAPDAIQPVLQICYTSAPLGVNAPMLGSLGACTSNSSSGDAGPCPTAADFTYTQTNFQTNGSPQFEEISHDIYYVHTGGPVTRPIQLLVQQEVNNLYTGYSYYYSWVTLPAGQDNVYIGTYTNDWVDGNNDGIHDDPEVTITDFTVVADSIYCPPVSPSLPPSTCKDDGRAALYAGKNRVFNDFINQDAYLACLQAQGATGQTTDDNYSALRSGAIQELDIMRTTWFNTLQAVRDDEFPSLAGSTLSDAVLTNLVNALHDAAKAYILIAPNDNIRAVSTWPYNPNDQFHSFTDVFNFYVGASLMQQGFNENLLVKPYPYDKTPFDVNPNTGDITPDICTNLAVLQSRYSSSGFSGTFHQYLQQQLGDDYVLTSLQLTELQTRCTNGCRYMNDYVTWPVAFLTPPPAGTPNNDHPFVNCTRIAALKSAFLSAYPSLDPAGKLYRTTFTNYMNHQLGYSLSFADYSEFAGNCTTDGSLVLYDKAGAPVVQYDDFSCTANLVRSAYEKAGQEYDRYIALERLMFRNQYISKCLSNTAAVNLKADQYEYHYTLYYYDQSGNLVKTIPPEGVRLLSEDAIQQVQELRNRPVMACTGAGIPMTEDEATTFNRFSTALQNNSAQSLEMWLYNNSAGTTRELRIITPDNKYLCQAAIADKKLWVELYTLQPGANGEISMTLTNRSVANIGDVGLQDWSHLVVQSAGFTSVSWDLYLDGHKLTLIPPASAPPYPFEWTIESGYTLPQKELADLKHFRLYNRLASDAEIYADYLNTCLSPVDALAVQNNPLMLWGRFNVPSICNNIAGTIIPNNGSLQVNANLDNNSNVFNTVSNDFTMELWVNPQEPHEIDAEMNTGYQGTDNQKYAIFPTFLSSANVSQAGMGISVGTNGVSVYEHSDSYMPAVLVWQGTVSGWTHVAVVYNGGIPSLYINGQWVRTGVASAKQNVYPSYNIGGGLYGFMPGGIDEVRIWSVARTAAQISASYLQGLQQGDNNGLLAYWPMSPSDGSTLLDISCNTNAVSLPASGYSWVTSGSPVNDRTSVETAAIFIVPQHGMPTNYAYNSINKVSRQTSPDAGTSKFWYDPLGRLAVSQNAAQATTSDNDYYNPSNRYSYIYYDGQGRITEAGERYHSQSLSDPDFLSWQQLTDFNNSGSTRAQTYTVYDAPPAWAPAGLVQHNLRKRISATRREQGFESVAYGFSNPVSSYYSYDAAGNVAELVQENTDLKNHEQPFIPGSDGLKHIKYQYDLVSGKVNKVLYQDGKWDQWYYQYLYDADNRLIKSLSSRMNYSDPNLWVTEASYRYYLHGPIARMELGKNKVQGVDYAYTLQGWLKGINNNYLSPDDDMSQDGKAGSTFANNARDVFGFSLGYYDNDYLAVGQAGAGATAFGLHYQFSSNMSLTQPLYNGNISNSTLSVKQLNGDQPIGYSYRYDQLNRLKNMRSHTGFASVPGVWSTESNLTGSYNEDVTYDGNGNIKTYRRNANAGGSSLMDDLTYQYNLDADGHLINNRLRHVNDNVPDGTYSTDIDNQQDDNYTYDAVGNIIGDKTIDYNPTIRWNAYGKIISVDESGGNANSSIHYKYDAMGNRVEKIVDKTSYGPTFSTSSTADIYVRDVQGNVLAAYRLGGNSNNSYNSLTWQEQDLYGSSRLGMLMPNLSVTTAQPLSTDAYSATNDPADNGIEGKRSYELSNHLGNVLVTISDKKIGVDQDNNGTTDYYQADVVTARDYYPFGMLMPGRQWNNGTVYKYGFNGKENDDELKGEGNMQDYGMRTYDPRMGRFLSVDPLAQKYPFYAPYQFAGNSPIVAIDLDGLEPTVQNAPKPPSVLKKWLKNAKEVHDQVVEEIARWILPQVVRDAQAFKTASLETVKEAISPYVVTLPNSVKKDVIVSFVIPDEEGNFAGILESTYEDLDRTKLLDVIEGKFSPDELKKKAFEWVAEELKKEGVKYLKWSVLSPTPKGGAIIRTLGKTFKFASRVVTVAAFLYEVYDQVTEFRENMEKGELPEPFNLLLNSSPARVTKEDQAKSAVDAFRRLLTPAKVRPPIQFTPSQRGLDHYIKPPGPRPAPAGEEPLGIRP